MNNTVENKDKTKVKTIDNKVKLMIGIAIGILLVLTVVLLIIEANVSGKMKIANNSDLKLEYIEAFFDTETESAPYVSDLIRAGEVPAGEKKVIDFGTIDLSKCPNWTNLSVRFKFEGYEEFVVSAGYFSKAFDGRIVCRFNKGAEGEIEMDLKTGNGLFTAPTSDEVDCNRTFYILLEEGQVW